MLRQYVVLLSILAFTYAGEQASAAGWRPVTPQDLKLSAADTGDPEADAAILFREGELNDNNPEGTSLKVYIRIKIFNERGRRYVDVQLPYRVELGRIEDVSARTIRPDGSHIAVEGRDIYDRLLVKTGHGIWRAKVFSMPAVEVGSIIEYRYRQTYPRSFRYFALDLQSDLFTKELSYRIQPQAASRLDVRWVTFNVPDAGRFAPVWDGTYNIRVENIPPFRREPLMPPELTVKMWGWLYYSEDAETNPDKFWREYAQRMHARTGDEVKPTAAIRRIVEAITLNGDGHQEKIVRIYNYIQNEIRNIGLREGREAEGGAELKQNDSADETLRRRYGTPVEINRLFISMLRAAGIDARVAELTTRDENFFHRTFPDSLQFNSELTAVINRDGSIQFYDPGTLYCAVGSLSWEKEAVPALIYGKRDWRFAETPVAQAAENNEDRRVTAIVQPDGRVTAQVELKLTGQQALKQRNVLADLTADERRNHITEYVRGIFPSAVVDEQDATISNLSSAAAPIIGSFSFSVPQLAARTEKRLLLRPALINRRGDILLAAPRRTNSIYFSYPWSESERTMIAIPEGYGVEPLPDPVDLDIGAARYQATFARQGRQLVYERRLTVNAIFFAADQYSTVKAFFDRVHQADQAAISFKQE